MEGKSCSSFAKLRSKNSFNGAKAVCRKNSRCIGVIDSFCKGTKGSYCMKSKNKTRNSGDEIVNHSRHCFYKKGK